MAHFLFNNPSSGSAYFVFSLIPQENETFPKDETQYTYISGSSFTNLSNTSQNNIVVNNYLWGAIIPPGTSSFNWGPSNGLEIPLSESKMIYTGNGTVSTTSGGEEFILINSNRWVIPGEISPGVDEGEVEDDGLKIIESLFNYNFNSIDNTRFTADIASGLESSGMYNGYSVLGWQTPLTISSWVKNTNPQVWGVGPAAVQIEGIGVGTQTFGEFYFQGPNLKVRFGDAFSDIILNLNELYHIAQVYTPNLSVPSESIFETYINGVKTTWKTNKNITKEPTFAPWWGTGPWQFGGDLFIGAGKGNTNGWNGTINEVAVFTSSLDAPTIESIYSASLPLGSNVTADLSTLSTPPVAWYRMGD
jgi:hypothetical protein